MAGRIRLFLLKSLVPCTIAYFLVQAPAVAAEENTAPLSIQSEQLIQPEVERRVVELPHIDSDDFEITGFSGILSIEDFGVNPVYGGRLAYHVNEDLFVEGTIAFSKAGETSYERLSGTPLPVVAGNRDITYYEISLGYDLLPGESFLTRTKSFNSALYVIAGVGNTQFAGSDRLTINLGGGFRFLATDWMAVHIDVRDHIFNIDILAEDKTANNLEVTLGLSVFF
jgi:outer membrane beta-barrel protein